MARTKADCEELLTNTNTQCEVLKAHTREEVSATRSSVRKECEGISLSIAQILSSVEMLHEACIDTKNITDTAFGESKQEDASE